MSTPNQNRSPIKLGKPVGGSLKGRPKKADHLKKSNMLRRLTSHASKQTTTRSSGEDPNSVSKTSQRHPGCILVSSIRAACSNPYFRLPQPKMARLASNPASARPKDLPPPGPRRRRSSGRRRPSPGPGPAPRSPGASPGSPSPPGFRVIVSKPGKMVVILKQCELGRRISAIYVWDFP